MNQLTEVLVKLCEANVLSNITLSHVVTIFILIHEYQCEKQFNNPPVYSYSQEHMQ